MQAVKYIMKLVHADGKKPSVSYLLVYKEDDDALFCKCQIP